MATLVLVNIKAEVLAELERRARARNRTTAEEATVALNDLVLAALGDDLRAPTDSSVPYDLPDRLVKGVARGRVGPAHVPDMVFPEAPGGVE